MVTLLVSFCTSYLSVTNDPIDLDDLLETGIYVLWMGKKYEKQEPF